MKIRRAFQSILPQPIVVIPTQPLQQLASLFAALLGAGLREAERLDARRMVEALAPCRLAAATGGLAPGAEWRETGPPRRGGPPAA